MSEDNKLSRVILMDAEEVAETLEIEFDEDQGLVTFICEDGSYQQVWRDQLETALVKLDVINKKSNKLRSEAKWKTKYQF